MLREQRRNVAAARLHASDRQGVQDRDRRRVGERILGDARARRVRQHRGGGDRGRQSGEAEALQAHGVRAPGRFPTDRDQPRRDADDSGRIGRRRPLAEQGCGGQDQDDRDQAADQGISDGEIAFPVSGAEQRQGAGAEHHRQRHPAPGGSRRQAREAQQHEVRQPGPDDEGGERAARVRPRLHPRVPGRVQEGAPKHDGEDEGIQGRAPACRSNHGSSTSGKALAATGGARHRLPLENRTPAAISRPS